MAIEDVSLPWGLTVFEGGAELDEYAKVALLSMMASQALRQHLYTDAVRRQREERCDAPGFGALHLSSVRCTCERRIQELDADLFRGGEQGARRGRQRKGER